MEIVLYNAIYVLKILCMSGHISFLTLIPCFTLWPHGIVSVQPA